LSTEDLKGVVTAENLALTTFSPMNATIGSDLQGSVVAGFHSVMTGNDNASSADARSRR
jgi:hypothetical protein